ncbi:hypothetical protein [uncultured Agrobacterium sp.]|uniref:hypothetical protein n=1 Tax=uncultured Agrobacterium sp. TaxID=157277 RepID=UPI0025E65ABA|nr:hypothetical protein [uncultured Agrobacterium sp.]
MKKPIDKAGLIFVALLCVLVGLVLSIVLFDDKIQIAPQIQDGSLIPRTSPQPTVN